MMDGETTSLVGWEITIIIKIVKLKVDLIDKINVIFIN